ncbi:hypothetical protein FQN57_000071 [Myotisia sp. PD_48]|nr:hypothetical protein FQN57_000071 [Myotisia sp. PD_48]
MGPSAKHPQRQRNARRQPKSGDIEDQDSDYDESAGLQTPEVSDDDFTVKDEGSDRPRATRRSLIETSPHGNSTEDSIAQDHRLLSLQDTQKTHSRRLFRPSHHSSKILQLKLAFGPADSDLLPIVDARDQWSGALDVTFPSRETLRRSIDLYQLQDKPLFGISGEARIQEFIKGWEWYFDQDIGGKFKKKQRTVAIGREEAQKYFPTLKPTKTAVLLGPVKNQTVFHIGQNECVDFGLAWKSRAREGWVINLGNRIQCLAWAPNCEGEFQYLAVVVPIRDHQKTYVNETDGKGAPAFMPSAPYPAAIQIWSFEAERQSNGLRRLSVKATPQLRVVICTDSGDIRRLYWSPAALNIPVDSKDPKTANTRLLSGIWGDGSTKVFSVDMDEKKTSIQYVHMQEPAFQVKPPGTVCTCLAWLSPSDIAIGCANGFIGLWNLPSSTQSESGRTPEPYMYLPMHDTYVLNIAPAYPTHPHIIVSTGMGGHTRMISLLDPGAEMVDAPRLRVGTQGLIYSPFLRSFITGDEGDSARLLPIRRFFTAISTLKSSSILTTFATMNFHHPCILVGNARGAVIASNPLRKLIHSKEKQWQQVWFTHEWVRGRKDPDTGTERGEAVRFCDGFKAQSLNLSRGVKQSENEASTSTVMTLYEEESAVTALAWNPNGQYAGWACAGFGSGLIRVEDLGHG